MVGIGALSRLVLSNDTEGWPSSDGKDARQDAASEVLMVIFVLDDTGSDSDLSELSDSDPEPDANRNPAERLADGKDER